MRTQFISLAITLLLLGHAATGSLFEKSLRCRDFNELYLRCQKDAPLKTLREYDEKILGTKEACCIATSELAAAGFQDRVPAVCADIDNLDESDKAAIDFIVAELAHFSSPSINLIYRNTVQSLNTMCGDEATMMAILKSQSNLAEMIDDVAANTRKVDANTLLTLANTEKLTRIMDAITWIGGGASVTALLSYGWAAWQAAGSTTPWVSFVISLLPLTGFAALKDWKMTMASGATSLVLAVMIARSLFKRRRGCAHLEMAPTCSGSTNVSAIAHPDPLDLAEDLTYGSIVDPAIGETFDFAVGASIQRQMGKVGWAMWGIVQGLKRVDNGALVPHKNYKGLLAPELEQHVVRHPLTRSRVRQIEGQ